MILGGCGDDRSSEKTSDTIPESTFVAVMAELHHATETALEEELSPELRSEILQRHGVRDQDLLTFADVHGGDVASMLRIWQAVGQHSRAMDAPPAALEPELLP
jgi:hypothetical protein